jgi:thiol-disulfide isomerase/thioredoxin
LVLFMRFVSILAAVAIALTLGAHAADRSIPPLGGAMRNFSPIDPPRPAPEQDFEDAAGRALTLAAFHGKVVLVNFWATWCVPCVKEMPALDRLAKRLAGPDFALVAIAEDRGGIAVVEPFLAKLGTRDIAAYIDAKGSFARALGIKGLPTTLLLDREGRAVGAYVGAAEWDTPEAEALIRHFMAPVKPAAPRSGGAIRTRG